MPPTTLNSEEPDLLLSGRGAAHPVGTPFIHVVSCAQPNCVSAGQSYHSSVGRKYSSQVTTSHVVSADYRVTTRLSR